MKVFVGVEICLKAADKEILPRVDEGFYFNDFLVEKRFFFFTFENAASYIADVRDAAYFTRLCWIAIFFFGGRKSITRFIGLQEKCTLAFMRKKNHKYQQSQAKSAA